MRRISSPPEHCQWKDLVAGRENITCDLMKALVYYIGKPKYEGEDSFQIILIEKKLNFRNMTWMIQLAQKLVKTARATLQSGFACTKLQNGASWDNMGDNGNDFLQCHSKTIVREK